MGRLERQGWKQGQEVETISGGWACARVHGFLPGGGGRWEVLCAIRFRSLNIRNIQNGGLESTLRLMSQMNVDIGVFR